MDAFDDTDYRVERMKIMDILYIYDPDFDEVVGYMIDPYATDPYDPDPYNELP
jgi:hypothetical protein